MWTINHLAEAGPTNSRKTLLESPVERALYRIERLLVRLYPLLLRLSSDSTPLRGADDPRKAEGVCGVHVFGGGLLPFALLGHVRELSLIHI